MNYLLRASCPDLDSLLSTGLQRNVQLRLQQFMDNDGQYEINSNFRLGFYAQGDRFADQRWGPLLADVLTAEQDIRILISSLDGDRVIETLSTQLGVDVLANSRIYVNGGDDRVDFVE